MHGFIAEESVVLLGDDQALALEGALVVLKVGVLVHTGVVDDEMLELQLLPQVYVEGRLLQVRAYHEIDATMGPESVGAFYLMFQLLDALLVDDLVETGSEDLETPVSFPDEAYGVLVLSFARKLIELFCVDVVESLHFIGKLSVLVFSHGGNSGYGTVRAVSVDLGQDFGGDALSLVALGVGLERARFQRTCQS